MVGGLLNDTRTQECRNQEPFPQNSEIKSFKFSTLFFSVVFSLCGPQTFSCLLGRLCGGTCGREMPLPVWGACISNPIWFGSSPSLGSHGMSPSLPLPGQCWHRVHQPGACTQWENPALSRGGERIYMGGQPASFRQERVNPGTPALISYCWLLWVKAFLALFQGHQARG